MSEIVKLKRSQFATFLKTGVTTGETSTPIYSLCGKGVTGQKIDYGAKTTSEQYVNEDSATTSVDGYERKMDTPLTCYKGDPLFEYVDGLRKQNAIGSELETDCILVYLYDSTGTGTSATYAAEKFTCVIEIKDFGGDAGKGIALNFNIDLNGDPVVGTASITSGVLTFTATA